MPVNLSKRGNGPSGRWAQDRATAVGPQAGFFVALFIAVAGWGLSRATMTPDLVMPIVATLILAFAAVFGAIAWRHGAMDSGGVTFRDVAGALTLIGLCAAAAIEPDQMVRLVQSRHAD